ncbi:MAG: HAD-IA family hydrolase [Clostridia bacterium]|nr:HAD-IA family hydrolase [Clostridia bacterium]
MKIKALILDAGGVMVKAIHGAWNIPAGYKSILGRYAAEVGGEKWNTAHDKNCPIIREDILMPGDTEREYALRREFFIAMAGDMGWALTEKQLDDIAHDFTWNTGRYIWHDDVNPYLKKWHGSIKTAMLSDAMPSFRDFTIDHGSDIYFDEILLSTDIGATKPDAKMYETIRERLGAQPEECLFVDDKEINLIGAQKCGMHAVQMDREGDIIRWNGPVVRNFEELDRFMEEMN